MTRHLNQAKNGLQKIFLRFYIFFQKPEHRWAFLLVVLILAFPLATNAGVGELALQAINYFLGAVKAFVGWLLELSGKLLGWVMSPSFNNLPLTHGHIVDIGWEILRQVANMFFIVALLIIAFATILGIESYGMRRMLPTLITMILLVNFSRVIAGVIVDASNILMKFFLSAGVAQGSIQDVPLQLAQLMKIGELFEPGRGILKTFTELTSFGGEAQNFAANLFAIIFMGLAAWIFFILALLFVARIVAIWMITILAPAAFVLTVIPGLTQWGIKEWFRRLFAWSFIGATAAFFIFLTAVLASELNRQGAAIFGPFHPQDIEVSAQFSAFIGDFAPFLIYLTILAFLFTGYKITLSAVPQGADALVNSVDRFGRKYAKKIGRLATIGLASKGLGKIRQATAEGIRRTPLYETTQKLLAKLGEKTPVIGGPFRYGTEKMQEASRKFTKSLLDLAATMQKAPKYYRQMYLRRGTLKQRAAALVASAREKELDEAIARRALPLATRYGVDKEIKTALPHLESKLPIERLRQDMEESAKVANFVRDKVKRASQIQADSLRLAATIAGIGVKGAKNLVNEGEAEQILAAMEGVDQFKKLSDQQIQTLASKMNTSADQLKRSVNDIQDILTNPKEAIAYTPPEGGGGGGT